MSFTALLWKDARRELRTRDSLQAGSVLVLLFLILDLFAFPTLQGFERAATAALWTPLLYGAGALAGRGFAAEADRGTLDLLRLAPVPLAFHGIARTLLSFGLIAVLALLTAAAAGALFAVPLGWPLAAALTLSSLGLAIVGTLLGALAAQARSREVLLPLLLVPAVAPLLQSGVEATFRAISGAGWSALQTPLLLMGGYDLIAAGVAWLLWPLVLEGD
jgi:heme exporter protein B